MALPLEEGIGGVFVTGEVEEVPGSSYRGGLAPTPIWWAGDHPSHLNSQIPLHSYVVKPGGSDGKESACQAGDLGLIHESGRFPWRRKWQPTPVFLPGEFH